MRKSIAFVAAVLFFVSMPAQASGQMRVYDYYSDSSFTQYVGTAYTNCSLICVSGCSTFANYRYVESENCSTGIITRYCQQWNGTGWGNMSCPF